MHKLLRDPSGYHGFQIRAQKLSLISKRLGKDTQLIRSSTRDMAGGMDTGLIVRAGSCDVLDMPNIAHHCRMDGERYLYTPLRALLIASKDLRL